MQLALASLLTALLGASATAAMAVPRQSGAPALVTPLHVIANNVELGAVIVNGTTATITTSEPGTFFYVDASSGYLYVSPTSPGQQSTPQAFIDFTPDTSANAVSCGASGSLTFAAAAINACTVSSPFSFVGNTLTFGDPTDPGTFLLCNSQQIVYTTDAADPSTSSCVNVELVKSVTPYPA